MRFSHIFGLQIITSLLTNVLAHSNLPNMSPTTSTERQLGDCQLCKLYVEALYNGMEKTSRGKFGDAAREHDKMKSHLKSEVPLLELQESLCQNTNIDYETQCHNFSEKAEKHIVQWWLGFRETQDLYTYLCIEKLENCCPIHHYGKHCEPCFGGIENVCSGNGKCKGDGTRKGNGLCACDNGYEGETCNKCASGFYESYRDDTKFLCSTCHPSCDGSCTQAGPRGCIVCKKGYRMNSENGCMDINECLLPKACRRNEFCVNNEGKHSCLNCDKSCSGCYGDGPDMCRDCAHGFEKKDKLCLRTESDKPDHLTQARYITYAGLTIAIGIIIFNSPRIAAFIGFLVISYIGIAEYYCMLHGHNHGGLINTDHLDIAKLFAKATQ